MEEKEDNQQVKEPIEGYGNYSYADYLKWEFEGMAEIIKGSLFRMAAAPNTKHQLVSGAAFFQLYNFLKGKPCRVFSAPFDVRLPSGSKKDEDIYTVVQPDICVVCDPDKIDAAGCIGAPDLVIEILSPGNNKKEIRYKHEVYEESGVKEYWVIHPSEETVLVHTLVNGKYQTSGLYISGDRVASSSIAGFTMDLEDLFA